MICNIIGIVNDEIPNQYLLRCNGDIILNHTTTTKNNYNRDTLLRLLRLVFQMFEKQKYYFLIHFVL